MSSSTSRFSFFVGRNRASQCRLLPLHLVEEAMDLSAKRRARRGAFRRTLIGSAVLFPALSYRRAAVRRVNRRTPEKHNGGIVLSRSKDVAERHLEKVAYCKASNSSRSFGFTRLVARWRIQARAFFGLRNGVM